MPDYLRLGPAGVANRAEDAGRANQIRGKPGHPSFEKEPIRGRASLRPATASRSNPNDAGTLVGVSVLTTSFVSTSGDAASLGSASLVVFSFLLLSLPGVGAVRETDGQDAHATVGPAAWHVGQWWSVAISDPAASTGQVLRIAVVALDAQGAELAYSAATDPSMALLSGLVPLGKVAGADLGFWSLGETFRPLRLPPVVGAAWSTRIAGEPVTASVTSIDAEAISVEFASQVEAERRWLATYEVALQFFSSIRGPDGVSLRVVDHGDAEAGEFLRMQTPMRLFDHELRVGAAGDDARTGHPMEQRDVTRALDRIAYCLAATGATAGLYRAELFGPGSFAKILEVAPADGAVGRREYGVAQDQDGAWQSNLYVVGIGSSSVKALRFDAVPVHVAAESPGLATAQVAPSPKSSVLLAVAALLLTAATGLLILLRTRVKAALLPLFTRLRKSELMDSPTRQRIMDLVRAEPGVGLAAICARLEIPWSTGAHHVATLRRHGLLALCRWGRLRSWFATEDFPHPFLRNRFVAMQRPTARRILERIRREPGIHASELARQAGIRHTSVLFHLRKLAAAGLILQRRQGRRKALFSNG
jgi:predicted transcriptional regulator